MPAVPSTLFARLFRPRPAPPPPLVVRAAGCSETGRRQNNQDALLVRSDLSLFVVADGMGGYEGGEIASATTIEALRALYQRHHDDGDCTWPVLPDVELSLAAQRALAGIGEAHRAVRTQRTGTLAQMGSTVVLAAIEGARLVIAHAGDSRAYRLRDGTFSQLTRDHSFLNELDDQRPLSAEDRARMEGQFGHVVTRAIGHGERLTPSIVEHEIREGDRYLLTSDGVHGWLEPYELAEILAAHPPEIAAARLVRDALDAGSNDNVTALVLAIEAR